MNTVNLWMGFDDRAQSEIKDEEHPAHFTLGALTTPSLFREDDPPGPRKYKLWSLYFPAQTTADVKKIRNELLATFPGKLRTVGAWWVHDGRMVGTRNVYSTRTVTKTWSVRNPDYQPDPAEPLFDDRFVLRVTGDVEEEYVTGHIYDPTFPLHTRILEFMPDVIVYDAQGNEVSRARPTELSDVNLISGQAPRNFL